MVVVATQGHDDEESGRAGGRRPARLPRPGRLAPPGRPRVLGYLAERGVPQDQLDRVRVPAGLDLGRTTHQEIAVAILAELVQLRASGPSRPRRRTPRGRQPGRAPGAGRGDRPGVRDDRRRPPGPSDPLEHEGATYYFCSRRLPAGVRERPRRLPEERGPMLIKNEFEVAAAGRQGLAVLRGHPAGGRLPARRRADRGPRRRQVQGPGRGPDGPGPAAVRRDRRHHRAGRGRQARSS